MQSIAAIHAAMDGGINWIDTAPVYGLGHSETIVGRAVKGLANRPYVFSKCSLVWDESGNISHDLQAASIRLEAESSLRRLGIDAIDLYQIHWPAWKAVSLAVSGLPAGATASLPASVSFSAGNKEAIFPLTITPSASTPPGHG
jgi:aryl-alcohol dehydrogenase-like predicted oxidoreductase